MSKSNSNLPELSHRDKFKLLGKINRQVSTSISPQSPDCHKIHGEGIIPWLQVKRQKFPYPVVIYSLLHGSIPDGSFVGHTCNNPWCVRPDHLVLSSVDELDSWKVSNSRRASDVVVSLPEYLGDEVYKQHLSGVRVRVLMDTFSMSEATILSAIGERAFRRD